jgi:adenosylcobinamide kinase/adenosylcobinamide-phosphate guanylyltransferase
MEVVLVGTGGETGWPEPGCRCASCASARAAGRARSPAAVRIDGDPIPDKPGRPGDRLDLGGHIIELHAGAGPGRIAWSVTGRDGARLLYAPVGIERGAPSAAPAAVPFGLVVLGPGPDGIASIARALARQRAVAAVTDQTDVVVTGLGHDDPPPATFDRLLAAWGARTVPDGTVVQVRALPCASGRSRPRLTGRTLVLGGARSGKSAFAEDLLRAEPRVTYLAAGGARAQDADWVARVAAHRRRRPPGWITEETTDVSTVLAAATCPVLLDCLGTWLAARVDHHDAWDDPHALGAVDADMADLVATWRALDVPVVAVSNEVGSGVVPAAASGRLFRDLLGRLNGDIAAQSETVLMTVAGLTIPLRTPA